MSDMLTCEQCRFWWHPQQFKDDAGELLDKEVWGTCQLHSHPTHESREGVSLPPSQADAMGDVYQTVPYFSTYRAFSCNAAKRKVVLTAPIEAQYMPLWHAMDGYLSDILNFSDQAIGKWLEKVNDLYKGSRHKGYQAPHCRWQLITSHLHGLINVEWWIAKVQGTYCHHAKVSTVVDLGYGQELWHAIQMPDGLTLKVADGCRTVMDLPNRTISRQRVWKWDRSKVPASDATPYNPFLPPFAPPDDRNQEDAQHAQQ